jgi:hypothetical protein
MELVGSGSKRRKIEIECASSKAVEIEAVSEDECEDELGQVMDDVGDVQVGDLWTGDDMGMYGQDTRDDAPVAGLANTLALIVTCACSTAIVCSFPHTI